MAHNKPGPEKTRLVDSKRDSKEVGSSDSKDERGCIISSLCERQRTGLGIFLYCFEELRSREIESAKRDLKMCRSDKEALLHRKVPDGTLDDTPIVVQSHNLSESLEPNAKRLRCEPTSPKVSEPCCGVLSSCNTEEATCSSQQSPSSGPFKSTYVSKSRTAGHLNSPLSRVNLDQLKERVLRNMDVLDQAYTSVRAGSTAHGDNVAEDYSLRHLADFAEIVNGTTLYGQALHVASLKYDISNTAYHSTVSSLEFSSAESCLFSVADISRTVQVFDIGNVLRDPNDFHYPVAKMECNAKISCVAWSPQTAAIMANSGYDGSLTVWDITKVRKLRKFIEHEKRCWSVCFSRTESHICATGSNDCSVKIWSLNMANSVMTVKPHFVVCAVNFGFSRHEIAVGSSDRSVYLYDLRQPIRPVSVFVGHRQAVSYVRYLNPHEIVSASTDNHLRIWNTHSGTCNRLLYGHKNTKNFVGLSSCGNHIITGSEDNRAYVYYKGVSRPVLIYDVDLCESFANFTDSSLGFENDSEVFVSAVAWRPASNLVLVGNSVGDVHVVDLR